jgi:Tol biopolymer transport system component
MDIGFARRAIREWVLVNVRAFLFSLAFGLAACASAPHTPPAPLRAPLEGAERIMPSLAQGFAVSPDGEDFLFSADPNGTMNAYVVSIHGGDPRALTNEAAADAIALSYFPNDDRILLSIGTRMFVVGTHLYVRAPDGGLTGIGGVRFLGWRGDGSAFYAASNDTIYAVDARDYSRETLFSGANIDAAAASRDGRWLALRRGSTISLVDLSASPRAARTILAGETSAHELFEFSSSGRSLVYGLRAADGFMHAWRYDLASGQTYPVMEAQADVLSVATSRSGRFMVLETGQNGAVSDVAAVDQQEDRALPLRGSARDVRFNRDDSRIFFRLADDGWPQDIFVSELDGERITRLVHSDAARD